MNLRVELLLERNQERGDEDNKRATRRRVRADAPGKAAASLALVVTSVLLMSDPLLAQGQELACRSHPKERPRIRKALPGGNRARKVPYDHPVFYLPDLRGHSVARRDMDR